MAAITAAVAVGVGSAYMQKRSADKATRALRQGQDEATAEQRRQYDQTRADLAPWRDAGANALEMLADPVKNFYASPDYEFRRSEGLRDTANMFNMRGGGGNAMKGITDYASNLASGEFGNWFNRTFAQSEVGRQTSADLAGLAGNRSSMVAGMQFNKGRQLADIAGQKYTNIGNSINNLGQNLMGIYGASSDRRLKTNIRRIDTVNGYPWYSFDWKSGGSGEGFMSDEVPSRFVSVDARGFDFVDYYGVIRS